MSLTINPVNNVSLSSIALTSPKAIDWGVSNGVKQVMFSGQFYAATVSAAHTLREDLLEIIEDSQRVNISYTGDTSINASYYVVSVRISADKLAAGLYGYKLDCDYVGASQ